MKKTIYILALSALLAGCAKDIIPTPTKDGSSATLTSDGLVSINFGISLPDRATVSTKSIGEVGTVSGLTLAVFGPSGSLLETAEAVPVLNGTVLNVGDPFQKGSDDLYHFNVTLHATDGRTSVHFIAGTHEDITPGSEGNIMGNLLTKAEKDASDNWTFPEAYWGRVVVPGGIVGDNGATAGTRFDRVPLIRNSVKITLMSTADNFAITGYELVTVPLETHTALYHDGTFLDDYQSDASHGYDWVKGVYAGGGWANQSYLLNIPSDKVADQGKDNVVYDSSYYQDNSPKYMYQRSLISSSRPTYLIVKGTYSGGATPVECYYKINLADSDDNLMPLYRNFNYIYTITEVHVKGEDTPYAASQSNGSGGVTVGVVTKYDTVLPIDENTSLALNWSEYSFNSEVYSSEFSSDATGKFLPLGFEVRENNVTSSSSSSKIYLSDENGVIFYAGAEAARGLPQGAVSGVVPGDASQLVFSRVSVTGTDIRLYVNQPPVSGSRKQSFTVSVGDKHLTVTVYALGRIDLGIECLNDVAGSSLWNTSTVETGLGKQMKVKVLLPQALPSSVFPLPLYIYVKNNSLSPLPTTDVSVGTGKSEEASTGTYYFKKVLSREEYLDATKCPIENGKVTVPLLFKTSKENSGSVVGVRADLANDAWTEFYNPSVSGTFSSVRFVDYQNTEVSAGAPLTLSFNNSSITTVDVVLAPGLELEGDYLSEITGTVDLSAYPEGSRAFTMYSVSTGTHTVALKTTADYTPNLYPTLNAYVMSSATGYSTQDIADRRAQLHVVTGGNYVYDVDFNSSSYNSNYEYIGSVPFTVELSKQTTNNTFVMNYGAFFFGSDNIKVTPSTDWTLTKVEFTMTSNQLGVTASVGGMSSTATGQLSPYWTGSTTSKVTFSCDTSGWNKTNVFTAMRVTTTTTTTHFADVPAQ